MCNFQLLKVSIFYHKMWVEKKIERRKRKDIAIYSKLRMELQKEEKGRAAGNVHFMCNFKLLKVSIFDHNMRVERKIGEGREKLSYADIDDEREIGPQVLLIYEQLSDS